MEEVLKAEELGVGYGENEIISGINLNAVKGQVVCLLGPNGAGKSTILRTLSGLLEPVSGAVLLDGEKLSRISKMDMARRVSVVLTEQPAPAMMTVYSLVSMGRTPYTDFMGRLSESDRRIIEEALETSGASALRNRYFSELSDGEKQKVMIARALVQEPEVIILDEPTSHLDIRHKIDVVLLLQRLSYDKGITCILSLHDIDLAIKGCQTVMLVSDGKVSAYGTPEEIIGCGVIKKLYDIRGAEYNELTGSVELKGADRNDVFVAAGNGTGINIYRSLARNGYGITSGVLHENDMDFEAASGICSTVISEKAFEPVSAEQSSKAEKLGISAKYIVDSGFPVGSGNSGNISLLKKLISCGKIMFSLRPEYEISELFGELAQEIVSVNGTAELLNKIKEQRGF